MLLSIQKYGIEIYGNTTAKYIYRIQVKQNKLLKLILSRDGQTPTIFIHSDFNILKVGCIYKNNILNFANKCVMGRLPKNFRTCYIIKVVPYAIRSTGSLDVIPCRTWYGAKTVKVNGAVLWSNIHRNIIEWRNMQDLKTSCWNTIYLYKCGEVIIIIYLYCKMQDVIIWKNCHFEIMIQNYVVMWKHWGVTVEKNV